MLGESFPWLTFLVIFPLLAATPIPLLPDQDGKTIRWYALGASLVEFGLILYVFATQYTIGVTGMQLVDDFPWITQFGLSWSLGVDGLSFPLVLLSGLVTTLAVIASWNIKLKPRLYYSMLLLMFSAQLGVFLAQDMMLFFIMWELELVPVYLLISIWGGQRRLYAATKFIIYTATCSVFILVAALALAFYGNSFSFNMTALASKEYPLAFQLICYLGLLVAFGAKLPIFPLHTWLPDAHSEAPAPVSMILAGVLLKMAGYGLIRMNIEMLPDAHLYFAPVLAFLGVFNIVYASLTAFAQDNLKRRLAYSSIAHMGFVLLGLAAFNSLGMSGAMLQMISHGLVAAVLFFLSGVAYERTHTLSMGKMGGMAKAMPITFALFTAGAMASLALPGMSGFIAEITVFLGMATSDAYNVFFKAGIVVLAAVGIVLCPIYLLSMLRNVFYGDLGEVKPPGDDSWRIMPREVLVAVTLLVPIIGIGLYPQVAIQTYSLKTTEVAGQIHGTLPDVPAEPPLSRVMSMPETEPTVAPSL